MTEIETERLMLRRIVPKDLGALLKIYNNSENMRFISNGKYNWTINELKEKYQNTNKKYRFAYGILAVVLKENGTIIGEAGLFNSFEDHFKLELGYIIDSSFWNDGFGKEVCQGLMDYAFKNLKVNSLISRMYMKNRASVNLSLSCGMNQIDQGITDHGEEFLVFEIKNKYQ